MKRDGTRAKKRCQVGKPIREWLTTSQLGLLCGLQGASIKRRIARGFYTVVKVDEDMKRTGPAGGRPHLVHISDPAIPEDVRALWRENRARSLGWRETDFPKEAVKDRK